MNFNSCSVWRNGKGFAESTHFSFKVLPQISPEQSEQIFLVLSLKLILRAYQHRCCVCPFQLIIHYSSTFRRWIVWVAQSIVKQTSQQTNSISCSILTGDRILLLLNTGLTHYCTKPVIFRCLSSITRSYFYFTCGSLCDKECSVITKTLRMLQGYVERV